MNQPNEIGCFNPLSHDFSYNYDDGQGIKSYTVRSREPAYFPPSNSQTHKKAFI